jgi:hypothetical protein
MSVVPINGELQELNDKPPTEVEIKVPVPKSDFEKVLEILGIIFIVFIIVYVLSVISNK